MTRKTVSDQGLLDTLLRSNFGFFVERCFRELHPGKQFLDNWHHQAITHELDRIRRGENTRLIVNLPPRSLKSLIISVAYPAFVLGHEPNKGIICASYGAELAEKHARDFRLIVDRHWYRRLFPRMRIARAADGRIETTKRGFRMSTTVMGALTGLGGDIIIVDDPQKAADALSERSRRKTNDWFSNTLLSRHDDKRKGATIVVMQRVHCDDLCEHLWETSGDWETLSLPAIAETDETIAIGGSEYHHRKAGEPLHPEREPIEVLRRLQSEIGSYHFAAQYQQSPVPVGGNMIQPEWLRRYSSSELPNVARSPPSFSPGTSPPKTA